jgi:hypothetical protein
VVVEHTSDEDDGRRCRSGSSCGQDSAALDYPTSLSFRIRQLAWSLVYPRRQGSHATWPASAWLRSLRSRRPHLKR